MSVQILQKFSPALKEIRIHLCPRGPTSNATRQFIDKYYVGIKKQNPDLPILVRECTGIEPMIWFRFEYNKEVNAPLNNLSADQIANLVKERVLN